MRKTKPLELSWKRGVLNQENAQLVDALLLDYTEMNSMERSRTGAGRESEMLQEGPDFVALTVSSVLSGSKTVGEVRGILPFHIQGEGGP